MRYLSLPRKYINRCFSTVCEKEFKTVVGLEVHAQLSTESKLFSGAQNTFGGLVNNCVSLFDAAIPGTLPVLNKKCVELGVLAALALSCKINEVSTFDRKHYFYADLPAGYQITQQRAPLANDGVINFQVFTPGVHGAPYYKKSHIKQIQLEQDSGKSLHDEALQRSLVDLNRAGAPLIELVFEPDLEDGEEAAALVKELVLILRAAGVCEGRMARGELRVDANVSLSGANRVTTPRTEIKNIGSVRGVADAIKHEAARQRALLAQGQRVEGGTRAWDAVAGVTRTMRDKDTTHDYRYMSEPNLPPLRVDVRGEGSEDRVSVNELRTRLPELPDATRERLQTEWGVRRDLAHSLVAEPALLRYFESAAMKREGKSEEKKREGDKVAALLLNDLLELLHKRRIEPANCPLSPETLYEATQLYIARLISLQTWKDLVDELLENPQCAQSPAKIVEARGWGLVKDADEIERLCVRVLEENPKLVRDFQAGKVKVLRAMLGQLAKLAGKNVDMNKASDTFKELIRSKK